MEITIIGAGTPTPTPTRFGSAYLVDVGGEKILFDCGPATTYKLVKAGVSPSEIDHLFFTHHHFDHDADFPTFALTRWDHNVPKDRVLHVHGPHYTEEFVRRVLDRDTGAFAHDWLARIGHPASQETYADRGGQLPRVEPLVAASDYEPGPIARTDSWEVRGVRAEHVQPYLDSLAYRLDSNEGSVVVTGDTRPCPAVTDLARGADTLLMMCWDSDSRLQGTERAANCTTIRGAAKTAAEADVGRLVMVHLAPRLGTQEADEEREAELREFWDGEVIWTEDLTHLPHLSG